MEQPSPARQLILSRIEMVGKKRLMLVSLVITVCFNQDVPDTKEEKTVLVVITTLWFQ